MRRLFSLILTIATAAPAAAQLPIADHAAKRQVVLNALTGDGIIFFEGTGTPPREDQTFMQSRDFQALTGLMQPNAALVMWKRGGVTGERVLVPATAGYSWDGEQIGPSEAAKITGIPGLPTTSLRALMDSLNAGSSKVYFFPNDAGWPGAARALTSIVSDSALIRRPTRGGRGGAPPTAPANDMLALARAVNQARAQKTDAEIALLKKAAEISVEGHKAAMRMLYPGVNEAEIRGVFEGTIFRLGAERIGYPSIVGTGANGTILHYSADTEPGSSGSPVFNDEWEMVALHHSGVPARDASGRLLAIDGSPWTAAMGEHRLRWVANEGARVSRVVSHLHGQALGAYLQGDESRQARQHHTPDAVMRWSRCEKYGPLFFSSETSST